MLDYDNLTFWLIEAEKEVEKDLQSGIVELLDNKQIPFKDISCISISHDRSLKYVININTIYNTIFIFKKFDKYSHALLFKLELEEILQNGYNGKLTFMDICKRIRNKQQ